MFGSLGVPELIFIFGLALLIFGPRKLPEIGRTIGRGLSEFRKASTDLKRSINAEMIEEEIRQSDPRKILSDDPPASDATTEGDGGEHDGAVGVGTRKKEQPSTVAESVGGAAPGGSVPRSGGDVSSSGGALADEPSAETSVDPEAP